MEMERGKREQLSSESYSTRIYLNRLEIWKQVCGLYVVEKLELGSVRADKG